MRVHELKTWPSMFQAIADGRKTFEVRNKERDYAEGDMVLLREWEPRPDDVISRGTYTGRTIIARIGYVLHGGQWGIQAASVVFALIAPERGPLAYSYEDAKALKDEIAAGDSEGGGR